MNLWRNICGFLDTAVYAFVEILLQTIMDLANVEIFTDSVINEFASRIYIILGLVMLFKIMISFIQILINPDKMNDKEQGVGNILKRVVISLALIFLVPSIFDLARQVQNYVIPVIPKVVLGVTAEIDTTNSEEANETVSSVGRVMAFYSFLPFFNYNNDACDQGQIHGTGSQAGGNSEIVPEIYSVKTAIDHVNDICKGSTDKRGYCYEYRWLISTAVGIYLIFILVQVAIAIAIRAIKLGICEFVAPIPIASYVDPKTSKQAFSNWVNTSVKTYLDLFIRLIVVYFVIFVFDVVFKAENLALIYAKLGGNFVRGALVTLFIILGLLQFAKQAPKFISDMLGIKGGGDIASMFKGAGSMFATAASTPFVGSRAARLARTKSAEAGESEEVQAYRARMAAMNARGRFIADRLRGKKIKESYGGSIDKAVSSSKNAIERTAGYTAPGQRARMSDVRKSQKGYISAKTRSYLGQSQEIEALDARLKNFEKVSNMVSDGRKSMASHKLAKAYKERYEAIKNTSDEVYQQQVRNSYAPRISELESELRSAGLTDERRNVITRELNDINTRIRNEARELKFRETNDASRAVDDVQKRLFAFAMNGNTEDNYNNILNDEDRRILGVLGLDRDRTWNDGEIIETTRNATLATQTAVNNAMITDEELRNAYGGNINIETMNVNDAGTLKDRSNRLKSDLENSSGYFEAKAKAVGVGGKTGNGQ